MKAFVFIALLFSIRPLQAQVLSIEISNIKSDKGVVVLSLYNEAKGFPYKGTAATKHFTVKPMKGIATLSIKDITTGSYAIALFHDLNLDQKLSTNALGIPKEGYAFSNNASNLFGVPSFKDASFLLKKDTTIFIKMKHF